MIQVGVSNVWSNANLDFDDVVPGRFSPNGRTLAVATRTGLVHLVDVAEGKSVAMVDMQIRHDFAGLITWTGPDTLTIDSARGAEIVVRRTSIH